MKTKLLVNCLFFLLICSKGFAQTFSIGHTTQTFIDPSRNNRNIAVEIYYPADVEGNDVAVSSSTFPVLAFGHGFVMTFDAYQNIWNNIVPKGFIMAFPKTEGGILPSHLDFAKDLAFVITELKSANQNPTSVFYNHVNAMSAVMGHSMGGGAAFLAAALEPEINALVVLAPAETNPSAIASAGLLSIPSLIFAGSNDCVTPPITNQIPMFDALQSDCKSYISITGGSHCQMADSNFLCSFGEATCSPSPTITRAEQHTVIENYLANWLKAKLKSDCSAGISFDQQLVSDNNITYQKNCLLCDPLANVRFQENLILVYPNPFTSKITVTVDDAQKLNFILYDFQLRKVIEKAFVRDADINLPTLLSGIYFYTITREDQIIKSGKLIKE